MGTGFYIITTLLAIGVFLLIAFFGKTDINRLFIKYAFLIYPLLAIDLPSHFFSVTIFDILTIVFMLFFYKQKSTIIKAGRIYNLLFVLLTVVVLIGIFTAESISKDTATAVVQYLCTFFFAKVLLEECLADRDFIPSLINVCKITLVASFVFLACQFAFGPGFSFDRSQNANVLSGLHIRYPSFFQDPQKYAQFLIVCIFLIFIRGEKKRSITMINFLLLLLAAAALMYTGGRASIGGLTVGLLIVLLIGRNQFKFAILTAGVCMYFFVTKFEDSLPVFNRMDSLQDDYLFRYSIWKDAFEIFKLHPVFGIGIDNYADYVAVHNPDQFWSSDDFTFAYFNHPESGYLKFLTEYGATGFLIILLLISLPLLSGLKAYFKSADQNVLVMIAAIAGFLVGFYTLYSFDDVRILMLFVTVICLLIARSKQLLSHAD